MDKKAVTFRIDRAILKKLKFIALERDVTVTELLLEAIQDLFKKYEKKTTKKPAK
jgi:predicted transcriptional regulator